jgi:hypothetical protein
MATYASFSVAPVYTRFPTQPKLAETVPELIAAGKTAHVDRPIAGQTPAIPASCAASVISMSCRAFPRTSTTSGATGANASGAYNATLSGVASGWTRLPPS